ncbi:MAG: NAD(P)/FAD-dependent oxidoreductase [Oscillospiraceae bacterium]|nr:NAD(P)/FAD-dependent oxidoreductase [Oscillospiraceae bacterium]
MYERIFTELKTPKLTFRNRMVDEPHQVGLNTPSENGGHVTEETMAFYRRRAQGGVGCIITELACVETVTGCQSFKSIRADDDASIAEFAKLASAIHDGGAKGFVQLNHPGCEANGLCVKPENFISASVIPSHRVPGLKTRAMTKEEIEWLADKYGQAALRVKKGGLDGVAIHAAHQYLIHQFLSPNLNKRTDEFGGCVENRARFLHMIIDSVRKYCGEDYPLMVRISAEEYVGKNGMHFDEALKVCKWCEEWGVDILDITKSGGLAHGSQAVEPPSFDQGWAKHFAKAVKANVNIPVCMVSIMREPSFAEWLLENNYSDLVGSARSFLADPDWVKKAAAGRDEDIMRCISCMRCYESMSNGGSIRCSVNPEAGLETTVVEPVLNGNGRKVGVIGGGPAGLEAAAVLAKRGFAVTVYEKQPYLGGQVYLGSRSTSKHKNMWLIETLERRCNENNVKFVLGCSPTIDELKSENYYAIIDAAGGVPMLPKFIEGCDTSSIVVTPPQVLRGEIDFNDKAIAVIGSGFTGLEVAEQLSERSKGNGVYVIEMSKFIAPDGNGSLRNDIVDPLLRNQVMFLLNRKCTKIDETGVYMEDSRTGEPFYLPCDVVVMSIGVKSASPYGDELETICSNVFKIGDELKPARIMEATRAGYEIGMNLQ